MTEAQCEILKRQVAFLKDSLEGLAEGDCSYGDDCPVYYGDRSGRCASCRAREALLEFENIGVENE